MKKSEILIGLGLAFILSGYYMWVTTEQRKSAAKYELLNFQSIAD